jgi:hypothetical protein
MPKSDLLRGILIASLAWPALAVAQTGGGHQIPDFSGGWARIGKEVEMFEAIPGHQGAGPMLVDPAHPHGADAPIGKRMQWITDLENPILRPETLARLQLTTEAGLEGIPHIKDQSMCQPSGVPMLWNRRAVEGRGGAIHILQTPDKVTIINPNDNQVRTVYLDVPHSDDPTHSWYGESVGHYEGGDTLVVDTIGQNNRTQIDRFGTTHSDQIHVVERFLLSPDRQFLEVQFTVEDPGAFTMPWSARVRHESSIRELTEQICPENNRFVGKVTVDGVITEDVPTPTDYTPDF